MTMAYSFVLCGPLPSHSHFQFPSFPPTKTPLSIPPSNLTPPQIIKMEFRPKNGFNLEEDDPAGEFSDDRKRRPVAGGSGPKRPGGAAPPSCQADSCPAVLTDAKRYHRRHKVCEFHAKSAVVVVAGLRQRFCQQCSRFHELSEFDEAKRSCRRRLAGHNERRRKCSPSDPSGDGPAVKLESPASRGSIQCKAGSSDEKSRAGISSNAGNSAPSSASAYNHFRIG